MSSNHKEMYTKQSEVLTSKKRRAVPTRQSAFIAFQIHNLQVRDATFNTPTVHLFLLYDERQLY